GTALLARTLARMDNGPRALVQASAVGYYGGQRPGELLTESDPGGEGFLAEVVRDWEAAARPAAEAGVRVAAGRPGVVLSDGGRGGPRTGPGRSERLRRAPAGRRIPRRSRRARAGAAPRAAAVSRCPGWAPRHAVRSGASARCPGCSCWFCGVRFRGAQQDAG